MLQKKKFNIFLISSHKHILWYSLEAPHLGTHNHIFVEKWSEALLMSTEMCPKVLLMNTQYLHFCREIKWGTSIEYHNIWFCGEKGTIFIWRPLLSGAMITITLDKALFFFCQKSIFCLFFDKNICCGYSLEVPHQGASNEYPQHMFSSRNKKIIHLVPSLV